MTRPGDGGSSGPPAGDSPGSQSNTYEAHGHCWWPQGDPDRLDRAAAAWEAAAKGIQRVAGDGDTAVRSVTSHNSGDAIDKFGAFWSKYYSGGSDTATLTQSADACLQIAHVCREHADGIRRARKEVIALAVAAAATVAVGLVLTFVSFGASDVAAEGAAAAITAEALALEETFSTLLMGVIRTALMGALKGAAFSVAYDAIIVQPIEMHFEPGRHFSIDEVGEWGLQGLAFGGAVEGGAATIRALRMARMLEIEGSGAAGLGGAVKSEIPEAETGLLNGSTGGGAGADGAASAIRPPDVPMTYRGDTRPPEVIFREGFQPRGSSTDLYDYASRNTASRFVGTSLSPDVAADFAGPNGWVYAIRKAGGINVNDALGLASPFPDEVEIVFLNGIEPEFIMGVNPVLEDLSLGPFAPNPIFGWPRPH